MQYDYRATYFLIKLFTFLCFNTGFSQYFNDFSEKDIKTIMEKTGCTKEQALDALEETGDLAGAILKLSE